MKRIIHLNHEKDTQDDHQNDIINLDIRNNFLFGIIGTNRTGKSVLAREMAIDWRLSRPDTEEYKIVAFDPQDMFIDIADITITVKERNDIVKLRNCLLILDDYKALHLRNIAEDWIVELMQFRSKWNIDIIYVTHNPSLVMQILTYYTTHYFIFYTQALQGGWKKKIPSYVLCNAASKALVRYVNHYGRGEYPIFPYFVVDNENAKVYAKNIDNKAIQSLLFKTKT